MYLPPFDSELLLFFTGFLAVERVIGPSTQINWQPRSFLLRLLDGKGTREVNIESQSGLSMNKMHNRMLKNFQVDNQQFCGTFMTCGKCDSASCNSGPSCRLDLARKSIIDSTHNP